MFGRQQAVEEMLSGNAIQSIKNPSIILRITDDSRLICVDKCGEKEIYNSARAFQVFVHAHNGMFKVYESTIVDKIKGLQHMINGKPAMLLSEINVWLKIEDSNLYVLNHKNWYRMSWDVLNSKVQFDIREADFDD